MLRLLWQKLLVASVITMLHPQDSIRFWFIPIVSQQVINLEVASNPLNFTVDTGKFLDNSYVIA